MEVTGSIKSINETQTFGASGFRKRELVVTIDEDTDYPQPIMIEFVQDKCDILNGYAVGEKVKVSTNLRGREWINPEGVAKYFNSIQGWRIEKSDSQPQAPQMEAPSLTGNEPDDLPF